MDKTVKIQAYTGDVNADAAPAGSAEGKDRTLDLAMKDAQIEEERSRSLEHLKTIVQLRETLKREQSKSAELTQKVSDFEAKLKAIAGLESGEVAARNAQLEAEKSKSLEYQKIIEQLRDSLKQEQAKVAALSKNAGEQEAMTRELAALEAKVRELPALEARLNEIPALEARVQELSVLETKLQDMAALESRVTELKEMLGKISSIAAAGSA